MNINPDKPVTYTYQASPEEKKVSLFTKIMGPLRRAIGSSIGKELGEIKLKKSERTLLEQKKVEFLSQDNVKPLNIEMKNQKGKVTHHLDGVFIENSNPVDPDKEKKYVLVFFGMGDCYEKHLNAMNKLAEDTDTTVVSFNYRGKGDSTGNANSAKDYIEDGKALIAYLESQGAKQENILLYGHSLGGGVAAKVSQELGNNSPIVSESSFSTFKKAVKNKKEAFTSWIMKKTGWNIKSTKALGNVNQNKLGIIVNRRDPTVHYEEAALYKGLKNKGVDKEFDTIKIGKKPSKENLDIADVKITKKSFKKSEEAKIQHAKDESENYKELQKSLKKAGWIQFLRHPHQMIIDQPSASELGIPDKIKEELGQLKSKADTNDKYKEAYENKEKLANELLALNQKYAQEDKIAYEGIVKMVKTMLEN